MNPTIANLLSRLLPDAGLKTSAVPYGLRRPTQAHKYRPAGRQNHSAGESKTRRKMAAASNRINRRRVRRWSH